MLKIILIARCQCRSTKWSGKNAAGSETAIKSQCNYLAQTDVHNNKINNHKSNQNRSLRNRPVA